MDALQKAVGATAVVCSAFLISRTTLPSDVSDLLKPRSQPQPVNMRMTPMFMWAHEYPTEHQDALNRYYMPR
jgi:hypothetical protein